MKRRILINISVIAAAVLLSVAAAEYFFRVLGIWYIPSAVPDWYRPSSVPGVPYVFKPNLEIHWGLGKIHTNEDGLRDVKTPSIAKTRLRVLALGDSVTFGFGVDQNDTFPRWMEKIAPDLSKTATGIEVINAGINGFNVADEAEFLPFLLDRYKPDVVVWTLIGNDFDDSLGVAKSGELTWSEADYVVSSAFLSAWGYRGEAWIDADDFRNDMNESALAWAEAKTHSPGKFAQAWASIAEHSVVASMINSLSARGGSRGNAVPNRNANKLEYQQEFQTPRGNMELPGNAALFYSNQYVSRGIAALEKGRKAASGRRIPLVVVNAALPIGAAHMKNEGSYFYYDLSALLKEPFGSFHQSHSLGWDPHLTSKGNQRVARAMIDALVCAKLMSGFEAGAACGEIGQWQDLMRDYWSACESGRKTYESQLKRAIDFDAFSGIHQIMGGIYPPRTFPSGLSQTQRANLILRVPSASKITLEATALTEAATRLEIEFRLGSSVLKDIAVFDRKTHTYEKNIGELTNRHPREQVMEIVLRCESARNCDPIRLRRIGESVAP